MAAAKKKAEDEEGWEETDDATPVAADDDDEDNQSAVYGPTADQNDVGPARPIGIYKYKFSPSGLLKTIEQLSFELFGKFQLLSTNLEKVDGILDPCCPTK